MSPTGVILGTFMPESVVATSIFYCISSGTFIYIATTEVIVEEFSLSKKKWQKLVFYLLGLTFLSVLKIFESHDH